MAFNVCQNNGEIEMTLEKEHEWIPLTKWSSHCQIPTYGTMRNIVARRNENGPDVFLSMINHRIYVNKSKFYEWMNNQKIGGPIEE